MSERDKNEIKSDRPKPQSDKENKSNEVRELTAEERKRLQERLARAKENDPNIYPLF